MKKSGFILIETITMFLVLISALMLFYVTANDLFIKASEYSNYDDVALVYSAYYIKEALSDFSNIQTNLDSNDFEDSYGFIVGVDSKDFFTDETKIDKFQIISDKLLMHQIFVTNDIRNLKTCSRNIDGDAKCLNTFLTEEMRSYIKTINLNNVISDYYIIVEFKKDSSGNKCSSDECFSYFAWVTL